MNIVLNSNFMHTVMFMMQAAIVSLCLVPNNLRIEITKILIPSHVHIRGRMDKNVLPKTFDCCVSASLDLGNNHMHNCISISPISPWMYSN